MHQQTNDSHSWCTMVNTYTLLTVLLLIVNTNGINWKIKLGVRIGNLNDGQSYMNEKSKGDLVGILHDLTERIAFLKEKLDLNTSHDNMAWLGISVTGIVIVIIGYILSYVKERIRRASRNQIDPPTQLVPNRPWIV